MKKYLLLFLVVFTNKAHDGYFESIPKKLTLKTTEKSTFSKSYGFKTTRTNILEFYTLTPKHKTITFKVSCSDPSLLGINPQEDGSVVITPLKKGSTQLRMRLFKEGKLLKNYSKTITIE